MGQLLRWVYFGNIPWYENKQQTKIYICYYKKGGTLLCILKVNKPGIQADKTLCLRKFLAKSPFWES